MDHERHVANDYKLYGHTVRLSDEFIECGKPNCRYSAYHNPNCANCLQTCQQICVAETQVAAMGAPQSNMLSESVTKLNAFVNSATVTADVTAASSSQNGVGDVGASASGPSGMPNGPIPANVNLTAPSPLIAANPIVPGPLPESRIKRWVKKGAKLFRVLEGAISLCAACLEAEEVLEQFEM